MPKKIRAFGELIRLPNVAIAVATGFVGCDLMAPMRTWSVRNVGCALGAIALMCLGGNVINDFFDIEIDRINRPDRPLPSGRISSPAALVMAMAAFLCSLALSFFLGRMAFTVGAVAVLLLVVYAAWLKRVLVIGNIAVAFISALTFPFVGAVFKNPFHPLIVFPAFFIFLFHFGREIIKDVIDMDGDGKLGAKTVPIVFGRTGALVGAAIPFMILIPVTILPFFLKIYGIYYLLVVGLTVDTVLMVAIIKLIMAANDRTLNRLSALLKFDMLCGLAALLVGRL